MFISQAIKQNVCVFKMIDVSKWRFATNYSLETGIRFPAE